MKLTVNIEQKWFFIQDKTLNVLLKFKTVFENNLTILDR